MHLTLQHEHDWDLTPREAIALQKELAGEVRQVPLERPVDTVAGLDVSIRGDLAQAAVSVLELASMETVDEAIYRCDVPFPYIPGLLSFREAPPLLEVLGKLQVRPDVLMCDSQGLAHPRRFGLACHLGVVLGWPTLGVAKSRLTGTYEGPDIEKGSRSPLMDGPERIGTVLRTRTNIKPVYVSVGHRLTLKEAEAITLRASPTYKIPEPTRHAHRLSRRADG